MIPARGWWRFGRFRSSIVVDADAIRLVRNGTAAPQAEILRDRAPIHLVGVGRRYRSGSIVAERSPAAIGLEGFDSAAVVRACAAHGWPLGAPLRVRTRVELSDLLP